MTSTISTPSDPLQPARSLTDLLTAIAALLAKRQPHNAPLLHSAWTVHEVITQEYRIPESVHCEVGTPTPAAWIQVFEKPLSLWCQQCSSRVPSGVLASGAQGIADVYVPNRPFPMESTGSSAWFVRVLDLSPDCQRTLRVMLRWLGLVLLARASSHFTRCCVCSAPFRQRRAWFLIFFQFTFG